MKPTIGDGVAVAALDQSHDLIVVLDDTGTIVLANAAWRAGADRRGGGTAETGCGANYLETCERSNAADVAAGIRAVLVGDLPRFELDYPCHAPLQDAWYALEVSALDPQGSGVVLIHTDITPRIAANWPKQRGCDVDPVTLLATSPAGVTGLARMLADAQANETSLAVVTITLTDLAEIASRLGRRWGEALIVRTVARVLRLTRFNDSIIRPSNNQLILFASVSDAQGGQFLRDKIAQALDADHSAGNTSLESRVEVTVVSSDPFSTLASLMPGLVTDTVGTLQKVDPAASGDILSDVNETDVDDGMHVPLVVYSLPDGYLQAANDAARCLFRLKARQPGGLHARDIADPINLRQTSAALSALNSGATDSYRAQRTLPTADGPLALMTSVRRLLVGSGALAVVLTVPLDPEDVPAAATDDPFAAALVAGTIDWQGEITSVSSPSSPVESELAGALSGKFSQAAHPDDIDLMEKMLATLRLKGSAAGAFRLPHTEHGWMLCQCQMFTIKRHADQAAGAPSRTADQEPLAFVVTASVNMKSLIDKVARLERHIRRIGSEVHAADVEVGGRPVIDPSSAAVLDALNLTVRQREIVERLVRGQRVASIATALYISRSTVRNHLAQVYHLVGVHSQEELLNALRAP